MAAKQGKERGTPGGEPGLHPGCLIASKGKGEGCF